MSLDGYCQGWNLWRTSRMLQQRQSLIHTGGLCYTSATDVIWRSEQVLRASCGFRSEIEVP